MLLPSHSQIYREFKLNLEELKEVLSQDTVDRVHLKSSVAKLQDFFHNQILTLDPTGIPAPLEHQMQSIQVEMDKQLKFLTLDGLFLQAAKQAPTVEQRVNQARDRLRVLLAYCDRLLAEAE